MIRFFLFCSVFYALKSTAQPANTGFFYGRTADQLPHLEYGLGDDRLGGAKMIFLDTSILVKVVDSANGDYKIQLSKNHFGLVAQSKFRH